MPQLTRTSYSRYFAWINNKFADLKQEDYDNFKKTAFAGLKDLISSDPKLREEKTLRILEIGAGVGACLSLFLWLRRWSDFCLSWLCGESL